MIPRKRSREVAGGSGDESKARQTAGRPGRRGFNQRSGIKNKSYLCEEVEKVGERVNDRFGTADARNRRRDDLALRGTNDPFSTTAAAGATGLPLFRFLGLLNLLLSTRSWLPLQGHLYLRRRTVIISHRLKYSYGKLDRVCRLAITESPIHFFLGGFSATRSHKQS